MEVRACYYRLVSWVPTHLTAVNGYGHPSMINARKTFVIHNLRHFGSPTNSAPSGGFEQTSHGGIFWHGDLWPPSILEGLFL